ncbi:MAG: glycosyltransferase family 9 protein, partial [Actinomycetota bacterium]|nr:glycosyltransferase family 9 protein [Actinomycetota bacterium]
LLEESGIPADPSRLDLSPPQPSPTVRGVTVVHPGAASAARRWPPERFAAVARAECESGRDVAVSGSAAEAPLAHAVARDAGLSPKVVLAGRTDPVELAALVGAADRVVCGDTGVAHLATACGTPSVVLFGPTSPRDWGPPADRPRHRALWTGRTGDPHAAEVDPGLLAIGVADVLEALSDLPGNRADERRLPAG